MQKDKINQGIFEKLNNSNFTALLWPLLALILILLYNLFFTRYFFHLEIKDGRIFGSLIDILNRAAPVMLIAIGMTLVIAIKGLDISVGSVLAISGAVAALLLVKFGAPLIVFVGVALLVSIICGAWNGFLVSYVGVQPIVATLILWIAGRGIAQLVNDGQVIMFENKPFEFIGNGYLLGIPFAIIIVAVVFTATQVLTRKTALGLFIESIGCNSIASRYSGINVRIIKQIVYIFTAFCAGVAGLIVTANIKTADSVHAGDGIEVDAILAVAIGGTSLDGGKFSLTGTMIGALIMQTLTTTILTRGVPVQVTRVIKALVVVAVFLLQSEKFRGSVKAKFAKLRREAA